MRRSITLLLSWLGLFDSLYLLYIYTAPSRPMVCIGTGCDAVRASAYSTLGGISVPVFGVAGYALISIVLLAESLLSARAARLARYAFLGMTAFGFVFSLYLECLQVFVIHAYCAWCGASGAVMTALFALAIVNLVRQEPEPAAPLAPFRSLFAVSVGALLVGAPAFYLLARHSEIVPAAPQPAPVDAAGRLVPPNAHEAGNLQAALTVVQFGDLECPACGRGEAAVRETRVRYAQRVRFVFRQFPLERIHPFAQKAAEASECAGEQGRFWEMVEEIYSKPDDLSVPGLERDGAQLELDQAQFHQCLESGAMAGRVRRDLEDGRALGVRATPTFFIGSRKVEGVLTAAQFSQLIEWQLAGIGRAAAGNVPKDPPRAAAIPERMTNGPLSPKPSKVLAPAVRRNPPNAAASPVPPDPPPVAARPLVGYSAAALGASRATAPVGLLGPTSDAATCSEAEAAKLQPTLISTASLRHLLTENAKPLLVDVRPASEYAAGRIAGAVNIPADEMARRWSTLSKDRTIILYESGRSSGDVCAASRAAARTLLENGFAFSRIKVYADGFAGWERAGIGMKEGTPAGAGKRLN